MNFFFFLKTSSQDEPKIVKMMQLSSGFKKLSEDIKTKNPKPNLKLPWGQYSLASPRALQPVGKPISAIARLPC